MCSEKETPNERLIHVWIDRCPGLRSRAIDERGGDHPLIIAWKVVREYLFSGFKAVLAAIIVGGIALWGIVAGPDFFRDQAGKEADAIINQSVTNTPAITVPGD